jgi:hypothetical protein
LEVRREQGGEPLVVPMVKDAIRRMAVSERRIDVDMDFLGEAPPREGAPEIGEDDLEPGERGVERGEDEER